MNAPHVLAVRNRVNALAAQLQALGDLLDAAPPDLTPAEATRVAGSLDRLSRYVEALAGRLGQAHDPLAAEGCGPAPVSELFSLPAGW